VKTARMAAASAPGKVILFGEHFVVKGSRALVASINLRVRVRVEALEKWPSMIESRQLGLRGLINDDLRLEGPPELEPFAVIIRTLERMGYDAIPFRAVIEGDLPPNVGLGSSAASSTAFALAYSALSGEPLDRDELARVAIDGERVVHANPSGVDVAVSVYGGFLLYRKGESPRRLKASLPPGVVLIVADTGIPRRTGDVVEHVLNRAKLTEPASRLVYEAAEILVDQALKALDSGDAVTLGALMDLAQGLLAGLGASSLELEMLLYAARRAGAYGAKLTGAGWGGSIIALASSSRASSVISTLLAAGARWARSVELGVEGARLEGKTYKPL
jgi:mevalonate kinase